MDAGVVDVHHGSHNPCLCKGLPTGRGATHWLVCAPTPARSEPPCLSMSEIPRKLLTTYVCGAFLALQPFGKRGIRRGVAVRILTARLLHYSATYRVPSRRFP